MPKKHFKTNLFFSFMTPPTPYPTLSGHDHRLIIRNKTKKGHNLVCWHPKNYPYHTEFVSWCVHHFLLFIFFPIRWGGGSALLEFSNIFFFWNLPLVKYIFWQKLCLTPRRRNRPWYCWARLSRHDMSNWHLNFWILGT